MKKLLFLLFFIPLISLSQLSNRTVDEDSIIQARKYYEIASKNIINLEFSEALTNLNRAIELDSTRYIYFHARGVANYELGNFLSSEKDVAKAVEKNFNIIRLTNELVFEKDEIESIEYYNYSISKFPNDPINHYQRGRINLYLKNYNQAINDFNNALQFSDFSESIPSEFLEDFKFFCHYLRGISKLRLGKASEAINDFNKALEKPAYGYDIDVIEFKISSLIDLQRYDKALELVLELIPDSAENYGSMADVPLFLRGFIYYQINDFEKSLEDFNRIVKIKSFSRTHAPSLFWRGVIKRDYLNDNVGAKSDFELSIQKYNRKQYLAERFETYDVNVCEPYFDYNDAINKLKEL